MILRSIARSTSRLRNTATPLHISASRFLSTTPPPPPFPVIPSCPSPTCSCAETPPMPDGLPLDYEKPLNGLMPTYAEQVLICTGQRDWSSKIEDDNDGDNLAADLKELLGRGGTYSDPFHNISVLNTSFPPSIPGTSNPQNASAYLVPSFKYVPFLPRISFDTVQALVKGYLLPTKLNPVHNNLSPIHRDRLTRTPEYQTALHGVQDVQDVLVLICGHGGRDMRCGIMGPLLEAEFEAKLRRKDIEVLKGPVSVPMGTAEKPLLQGEVGKPKGTARVGLISHIGGHKFAGNVIIYIPPGQKAADGKAHALAGCGVWYGRVEPQHVEGIVEETVLKGRVIQDKFRGGIRKRGEILRL